MGWKARRGEVPAGILLPRSERPEGVRPQERAGRCSADDGGDLAGRAPGGDTDGIDLGVEVALLRVGGGFRAGTDRDLARGAATAARHLSATVVVVDADVVGRRAH